VGQMPIGTVRREMLKARAAIIKNTQHVHARVMQHDAVNLQSAGTRREQPGVEQGISFMGATMAQCRVDASTHFCRVMGRCAGAVKAT
jgi:hypothetical protein